MGKEKKYQKTIYDWPENESSREKLLKFSTDKLSDTELLAILYHSIAEELEAKER
ncbi:MAG: UPF0758 domain-containing protein [Candidatus Ratteibacteria bacterium]